MKKVLIVCTGNSCRSIMAEAIINHLMADSWTAYSAGTHPSHVHPLSIKALQEIGIATGDLRSKSYSEFWDRMDLDLVITVCDQAKKRCPAFYKNIPKLHLSLEDPVCYTASNAEQAMRGFRKVRQDIITSLLPLLSER